jgi:hypothetical protein
MSDPRLAVRTRSDNASVWLPRRKTDAELIQQLADAAKELGL